MGSKLPTHERQHPHDYPLCLATPLPYLDSVPLCRDRALVTTPSDANRDISGMSAWLIQSQVRECPVNGAKARGLLVKKVSESLVVREFCSAAAVSTIASQKEI